MWPPVRRKDVTNASSNSVQIRGLGLLSMFYAPVTLWKRHTFAVDAVFGISGLPVSPSLKCDKFHTITYVFDTY